MHFLIISSCLLKEILTTIFIDRPKNFVFHMIIESQKENSVIFQTNYNNAFYTSYEICIDKFIFFDSIGFKMIVLNYEQCTKLLQLVNMFDTNVSFGYNEIESVIEIVISHSNIKLLLPVDDEIDHNYLVPPEHNKNIPYINIDKKILSNVLTLVNSDKFYTYIRVDSENKRLIFGEDNCTRSIIQLPRTQELIDSSIDINPDSIILFLKNLRNKTINIKVNESIAFIINLETEWGPIYYYRAHEI